MLINKDCFINSLRLIKVYNKKPPKTEAVNVFN